MIDRQCDPHKSHYRVCLSHGAGLSSKGQAHGIPCPTFWFRLAAWRDWQTGKVGGGRIPHLDNGPPCS